MSNVMTELELLKIDYFHERFQQYLIDNPNESIDADALSAGWEWAFDFLDSVVSA